MSGIFTLQDQSVHLHRVTSIERAGAPAPSPEDHLRALRHQMATQHSSQISSSDRKVSQKNFPSELAIQKVTLCH